MTLARHQGRLLINSPFLPHINRTRRKWGGKENRKGKHTQRKKISKDIIPGSQNGKHKNGKGEMVREEHRKQLTSTTHLHFTLGEA